MKLFALQKVDLASIKVLENLKLCVEFDAKPVLFVFKMKENVKSSRSRRNGYC